MSQQEYGDILSVSMDKIKEFADAETVIGNPIYAPGGMTVIPVSKLSMGMATGGLGYQKHSETRPPRFGAGGGTGMNITPIAFLMITEDGTCRLLPVESDKKESDPIGKITELIERSPEIARKLKQVFFPEKKEKEEI